MTPVVATAVGLLVVGGVLSIIAGARRTWPEPVASSARGASLFDFWTRVTRRPAGVRGRRRDLILLGSLLAGFVTAAGTGWVIAVPLAPALALGLPFLLVLPKAHDVELLEALDRWIRGLAATLATGKSITDAIRISRRTAPRLIAEDLNVCVSRLSNRWETKDALMRFADALDSPDSDAVVAALILAAQRGSNGASLTLHALADSLQSQLKGRRVIETERAKPYIIVRQVLVITLVTVVAAFVLSPGFFAPYGTPIGQLILFVLICLYVGSLVLMRRKAQQRPRERILVRAS